MGTISELTKKPKFQCTNIQFFKEITGSTNPKYVREKNPELVFEREKLTIIKMMCEFYKEIDNLISRVKICVFREIMLMNISHYIVSI